MTSRMARARSGVFSDADPHLAHGIGGIDGMYACATSDEDHHSDRYRTGESYILAVTLALHIYVNQIFMNMLVLCIANSSHYIVLELLFNRLSNGRVTAYLPNSKVHPQSPRLLEIFGCDTDILWSKTGMSAPLRKRCP